MAAPKPGAKVIDGPSSSRPALLEAVQQELGVMQDDEPREGAVADSQAVGGEGQQRKRRRLLTTSTGVPLYTKPLPGQLGARATAAAAAGNPLGLTWPCL